MWFLAISLPLLPVIIVTVTRYWDELGALYQHLLRVTPKLSWQSPVCVRSTHSFVFTNCTHGQAESVLETFHLYAQTHPSLSLGPQRGELLDEVVRRVAPSWTLELGTHCGYASVRILRLLPPTGRLVTVENDVTTAEAGEEVILVAGFKHSQFQLMTCPSKDAIPGLRAHVGQGLLQLVLMDHEVGQYLADLLALEQEGLMAPDCVLLFNNTQLPAARSLLQHVDSKPECYTVRRELHGLLELQRHLLDTPAPQGRSLSE
ncbi:hypothetical protein COCON_G00054480 [Conger conger]|uniref:catechol O-methyltransferase n=1 Tax=Conger conger TaxID=82655 RepID=A0A9Q1I540_CONCO|nr:hypothetical protein COCON_G00054480 [Conger conger]